MNKWEIDKSFNWEGGHRVWAQKLEHLHLSLSADCACKHLHGHSYELKIFLGSDTLDQSAMVTDFKNINFMKVFIDEVLDHKFMIDVNDPNFELITGINAMYVHSVVSGKNFMNLGKIQAAGSIDTDTNLEATQLHRDSFVLVNFIPTSENICKHIKEYAQSVIGEVANVIAVELWETRKSHCRYIA